MSLFPSNWDIPHFTTTSFAPRHTKYALVIPVINEGKRIQNVLRKLEEQGFSRMLDIVIADGGSTDGSLDVNFLHRCHVRVLLCKQDRGKLSAQLRMAYAWALQEGYEGVITLDGNDKDSVESMPNFIRALENGIDYVQASRFIRGGQGLNTPWFRLFAIRLLHAPITSFAAKTWLTDTTQGFRGYSRTLLLDPKVQPFRSCFLNYELLAYLSVRAGQLGYKVQEVPTVRSYPSSGTIPTKIHPIHGSVELLRVLFKACTGGYNP